MANYKLVTIDQRFIAETIARTGTDQILDKGWRGYVGLYNTDDNWYLPLHGRKPKRKPQDAYYETPFVSRNAQFKNPGLDFQKALYVPENRIIEIENTLPREQNQFIQEHFIDIKEQFEKYVIQLEKLSETSAAYAMSTVPLFPEGMEKIKKLRMERARDRALNNELLSSSMSNQQNTDTTIIRTELDISEEFLTMLQDG